MKFLSNFDTNLEKSLLEKYEKDFSKDRVMSIRKSKFYYRRYIGIPLFLYVVLLIVSGYVVFMFPEVPVRGSWAFLGVFLLYGLSLFLKLGHKWVDYKMDFLIITPKEISKYEQTGMFSRVIEKIHTNKIKSISIEKPGFFNSIFDIGSLTFLVEGNDEKGDIVMHYVDAIESVERRIGHVIGLDILEK